MTCHQGCHCATIATIWATKKSVAEIVAESVATGKIVAAQIIVTILHIVILYV